jgi:hypothetical protein
MENEKVLIAGGLLVGAFLLFGGGKKKKVLPTGGTDEDIASDIAESLDEDLQLDADELADISDGNGNGIDFDDPGELDDYFEEEITERAKALADKLTSISASGGGGGGDGGEVKDVAWCGRMVTAAQANAYLGQMLARNGPDGKYEENPKGSNCWKWIPTKKHPGENENGNGNGNGRGEEGEGGPPGMESRPPVATGGGWTGGVAPVHISSPGAQSSQGEVGVDPFSFTGSFY